MDRQRLLPHLDGERHEGEGLQEPAEVVDYSARYRRRQLEVLSRVLEGYGLDVRTWPPVSLLLAIGSISLVLRVEQGFGFDLGHDELIGVVERQIRELEGERWHDHPALAHRSANRR